MTTPDRPTEVDLDGAIGVIARAASAARRRDGRVDVVVPGGRGLTPLVDPLLDGGVLTRDWCLHLSDERVVPRGHPDRNVDGVATLLGGAARPTDPGSDASGVPILVGPPDGPDGLPSAVAWTEALARVPRFAVTILGVGADGHTAGLFPGGPLGADADAPDALDVPPTGDLSHRRVTQSARRLARSDAVLFIAVGAGKEAAVAAVRAGADTDRPTGAIVGPPRYLLVVADGTSRKSTRV